ncbi:MAG: methyltransferase domain-containing protein [Chthoniobacterales bacterium]
MLTNFLVPARAFDPSITEIMDRPQPVSRDLMVDLANLTRINRYFGSYSLIRHFLRRWLRPGDTASILDLCTASADIPRFVADWARHTGVAVRIVGVDFQESTLEIARRQNRQYPEIELLCANVLEFEPAEIFDLAFCSLALHHFSDADAELLLRRIRKFATRGVLVSDIARSDLGVIGIYTLTATFLREPMTRFDARLSMKRAFSVGELRALAARAGWKEFGHRRFRVSRQAIWLERARVLHNHQSFG